MCWASGNGVSPSVVWPGAAAWGAARSGQASCGMGCDGSTEGLRAFPAAFIGGQGAARSVVARLATARRGRVRQGSQTVARRASAFPATLTRVDTVWLGHAGRGRARRGRAWRCRVRPGGAWATDSSTELLRRLPAALIREQIWRGMVRRGKARRNGVRHGLARRGGARQGLTISARRAQVLPAGFTQHT